MSTSDTFIEPRFSAVWPPHAPAAELQAVRRWQKLESGIDTVDSSMTPIVDHIQITVRDMAAAAPFYDRLLPILGFSREGRTSAVIDRHDLVVIEYSHERLCLGLSSPRSALRHETVHRRRPGALHHLAFRADSRAEVDRLHDEIKAIGATIVAPPKEYPEYKPPGYYAFFFKDPDGIKYEVVTHAGVNTADTGG